MTLIDCGIFLDTSTHVTRFRVFTSIATEMMALLATAALALNIVPSAQTRRGAIIGAGLAAGTALPVAAGPLSNRAMSKEATGVRLILETFDGKLPDGGYLPWLETHLSPDFQVVFKANGVTLNKEQYIAASSDLLKSFPDLAFTRQGPIQYDGSPFFVAWTAVVKGTHSGEPYSPLPGVPAVKAKTPPVACENDSEKLVATVRGTIIEKIEVEPIPGGKGFSGPVGFYLQAGGDPSKLPK